MWAQPWTYCSSGSKTLRISSASNVKGRDYDIMDAAVHQYHGLARTYRHRAQLGGDDTATSAGATLEAAVA
jgi:hypothetical protein